MKPQLIAGIVLMVAGIVLLIIGLNASDSVADRMSNFFTGEYTEKTVWYMLGGGAMAVGGLVMTLLGAGSWGWRS